MYTCWGFQIFQNIFGDKFSVLCPNATAKEKYQ